MSDSPSIVRNSLTLASLAAICTALVATTYHLTTERIAANEQALLEKSLQPVLSGVVYDSGVTESRLLISPPHGLPGEAPAIIYRVFASGAPAAALFVVTAADGYAGPVRVLIGIGPDGIVTGVRILQHRETPGLGDRIDSSRSDWVEQFPGRALGDPPVAGWAIREDGGIFDQLTGASITPRAVIKAIKATLVYFDANRDLVFALPAAGDRQ